MWQFPLTYFDKVFKNVDFLAYNKSKKRPQKTKAISKIMLTIFFNIECSSSKINQFLSWCASLNSVYSFFQNKLLPNFCQRIPIAPRSKCMSGYSICKLFLKNVTLEFLWKSFFDFLWGSILKGRLHNNPFVKCPSVQRSNRWNIVDLIF